MKDEIVQSAVQKACYLLGPEFANEILPHAENHSKTLARLTKTVQTGNKDAVAKQQRAILKSYSSKLVCLVLCAKKSAEVTAEYLRATATVLNAWHDPAEPIAAWAEPKSSGEGWRPITAYGSKRSALQKLCADILAAKFGVKSFDFLVRGRGTEIASDRIVYLIEKEHLGYFVIADIKDFFRSVQQKTIKSITGLPEGVIKNCILIGSDVHILIKGSLPSSLTNEAFDGAVRQGLPQGSRASQLIAGRLLGLILGQVAPEDRIVLYGDDVAIAASDGKEAIAFEKALLGAIESHPAGPFQVKTLVVKFGNGFDFLKYHFRPEYMTGKVHRRPSNKSYGRYRRKVALISGQATSTQAELKAAAQYMRRWWRSFRRWPWTPLAKGLLWTTTLIAMSECPGGDKVKASAPQNCT